jgi:hypothetical protein
VIIEEGINEQMIPTKEEYIRVHFLRRRNKYHFQLAETIGKEMGDN